MFLRFRRIFQVTFITENAGLAVHRMPIRAEPQGSVTCCRKGHFRGVSVRICNPPPIVPDIFQKNGHKQTFFGGIAHISITRKQLCKVTALPHQTETDFQVRKLNRKIFWTTTEMARGCRFYTPAAPVHTLPRHRARRGCTRRTGYRTARLASTPPAWTSPHRWCTA